MSEPSSIVLIENNEPLVALLRAKWEELVAGANLLLEKGDEKLANGELKKASTIDKACHSLCNHRTAITTAQEAKKLKHVGPWILKILDPFFEMRNRVSSQEPGSQPSDTNVTRANGRAKRKYIPAKNSGGFALLITLLRASQQDGKDFMRKQELIEEADNSGLSSKLIRTSAAPRPGGELNLTDMYSGWSNMGTLIRNSLVVKSSNPAKYMLTDAGKSVAQQCMEKAGLTNCSSREIAREEERRVSPVREESWECSLERQESSSPDEDVQEICWSDLTSKDKRRRKNNSHIRSSPTGVGVFDHTSTPSNRIFLGSSILQAPAVACGTERITKANDRGLSRNNYAAQGIVTVEVGSVDPDSQLAVPPLAVGEKFSDAYEIVCILDNREQFRRQNGSNLQNFAQSLMTQFDIKVEMRMLPVGDSLWIARHKQKNEEYVLEFVLERKNVDDLWMSIKDTRYKEQKLRLMNCGLKRLLYLVEGDVNKVESTETLKTAMFTTELQGFRILKTDDQNDTCKQYGNLTKAILSRYNEETGKGGKSGPVSKTYKSFVEHCKDFLKDRVKDVFCRQLTQIGQVTEEIACSIQDRYPTLFSIATAFGELEGKQEAQEKLLHGIPIRNTSKTISVSMSKNIYKAIWAP